MGFDLLMLDVPIMGFDLLMLDVPIMGFDLLMLDVPIMGFDLDAGRTNHGPTCAKFLLPTAPRRRLWMCGRAGPIQ